MKGSDESNRSNEGNDSDGKNGTGWRGGVAVKPPRAGLTPLGPPSPWTSLREVWRDEGGGNGLRQHNLNHVPRAPSPVGRS